VFMLIHVGQLALDVDEDLLPHGKLKLDNSQLSPFVTKGSTMCEGNVVRWGNVDAREKILHRRYLERLHSEDEGSDSVLVSDSAVFGHSLSQ
jgi:hypothetical protein